MSFAWLPQIGFIDVLFASALNGSAVFSSGQLGEYDSPLDTYVSCDNATLSSPSVVPYSLSLEPNGSLFGTPDPPLGSFTIFEVLFNMTCVDGAMESVTVFGNWSVVLIAYLQPLIALIEVQGMAYNFVFGSDLTAFVEFTSFNVSGQLPASNAAPFLDANPDVGKLSGTTALNESTGVLYYVNFSSSVLLANDSSETAHSILFPATIIVHGPPGGVSYSSSAYLFEVGLTSTTGAPALLYSYPSPLFQVVSVVPSGVLPPGLTLNMTTGEIAGTPTDAALLDIYAGYTNYSIELNVSNAYGWTTVLVNITVFGKRMSPVPLSCASHDIFSLICIA